MNELTLKRRFDSTTKCITYLTESHSICKNMSLRIYHSKSHLKEFFEFFYIKRVFNTFKKLYSFGIK